MTIGKKIRQLRKANKITQEGLARLIDVSLNSVSFWENEKAEPSIFNCICLADVFGVSLDELCCRGEYNV
jgi:DNA-binding XRE family transcriptional regulator